MPPVARVPEAIEDLVAFVSREDLPVLARVAVAHAQFETIHPFPDGNGRTGRALLHAMLRQKGLAEDVSVPISSSLLTDTGGYFDTLTRNTAGNAEPIVSCVAGATLIVAWSPTSRRSSKAGTICWPGFDRIPALGSWPESRAVPRYFGSASARNMCWMP